MRGKLRYWLRGVGSAERALDMARRTRLLRQLRGDQRGVVAIIVALAATVLFGFAALGVETGLWYAIKRQSQSAADAAALSGAYELAAGQTYSDICAQAQHDAAANGFTFSNSYACPTSTPSPACTSASSGKMCLNQLAAGASDDGSVEVYLARQQNTFLADLFRPSVTIGTHAVATVTTPGYACDLALGKTGTDITVQGSATVNLSGCGMAANSNSTSSISFGGGNNDILDASWFQTVGNYSSGGNPAINVPTRLTDAAAVTDPYSCNPPAIGCAGKITFSWPVAPVNSSSPCYADSATPTTLQPGLYGKSSGSNKCSDGSGNSHPPMTFTSGTTTLCPGVYYLDGEDNKGGAFYLNGGTVTMGTAGSGGCPANGINGVTIIASSQSGTKGGGLQIKSGSVTLSAPTSSPVSGIPSGLLFYQDPAHADTSKSGNGLTGDSTITANSTTPLKGVVYTPATNVTFTGNNGTATCFIVIALTITFTGNSTMAGATASCTAAGVTGPSVLKIALTQ